MNITKLRDELPVVTDIEIVITFLPEMRGVADQPARHALLQRLESVSKRVTLGLADEQVNVLWHDDVSVDAKSEAAPNALKSRLASAPRKVGS